MQGAEEAYRQTQSRPRAQQDLLNLLHQQGQQALDTGRQVAEEQTRHSAAPWQAAERALGTGMAQYDKSYDRAYQGQRDQQAEGRAQRGEGRADRQVAMSEESHGWDKRAQELSYQEAQAASANRQNLDAYRNAAGADGKPRWQAEYEADRNSQKVRDDLSVQATRSGIAASTAQIRQMLSNDEIQKADRAISQAQARYGAVYSLPPDKQAIAEAQLDREYSQLTPGQRDQAKIGARRDLQGAAASKDLLVGGSPEGQQAVQTIGDISAKANTLANISGAISKYRASLIGTEDEAAALAEIRGALVNLKPEIVQTLDARLSMGGSRSAAIQRAFAEVKADLQNQLYRAQSQYGTLQSNQIQGQLQRVNVLMQQLSNADGTVDLVGGGKAGNANGQFLKGKGFTAQPLPGGQMMPANVGPAQQQQIPSMRGR